MGKSAPRKTFEILFWPKTSKNDHSREGMRFMQRGMNLRRRKGNKVHTLSNQTIILKF